MSYDAVKIEGGFIDYTPPRPIQLHPDSPTIWARVQVKVVGTELVRARVLYSPTGNPDDLWYESSDEAEVAP